MEDTLRALAAFIIAIDIHVLILVLMEDTLRVLYLLTSLFVVMS